MVERGPVGDGEGRLAPRALDTSGGQWVTDVPAIVPTPCQGWLSASFGAFRAGFRARDALKAGGVQALGATFWSQPDISLVEPPFRVMPPWCGWEGVWRALCGLRILKRRHRRFATISSGGTGAPRRVSGGPWEPSGSALAGSPRRLTIAAHRPASAVR